MTAAWLHFLFDPPLCLNRSSCLPKHHTTIQRTILGNILTTTLLIQSSLVFSSSESRTVEQESLKRLFEMYSLHQRAAPIPRQLLPLKLDWLHYNYGGLNRQLVFRRFFALLLTKLQGWSSTKDWSLVLNQAINSQIFFWKNCLSYISYKNCKEIANKIFFLLSNKNIICRGALTSKKTRGIFGANC